MMKSFRQDASSTGHLSASNRQKSPVTFVSEVCVDSTVISSVEPTEGLKQRVQHSVATTTRHIDLIDDFGIFQEIRLVYEQKKAPPAPIVDVSCNGVYVDWNVWESKGELEKLEPDSDLRITDQIPMPLSPRVKNISSAIHRAEVSRKRNRQRQRSHRRDDCVDGEESKKSRVGVQFQASITSSLAEECQESSFDGSVQIWDPTGAAKIAQTELDRFMNGSNQFNVQMKLMEAMHRGGYRTKDAYRIFLRLHRQRPLASVLFNNDETTKFNKLCRGDIIGKRKDFHEAARVMNRPIEMVLVHYYKWKAKNQNERKRLKENEHAPNQGSFIRSSPTRRRKARPSTSVPGQIFPDNSTTSTSLSFLHAQAGTAQLAALRRLKQIHKEFSKGPGRRSKINVRTEKVGHESPNARGAPGENSSMEDFFGNIHSDEEDTSQPQGRKRKRRDEPNSDEELRCESDSDYSFEEEDTESVGMKGSGSSLQSKPMAKRTKSTHDGEETMYNLYDVRVPIQPEGFLFTIGRLNTGQVVFARYCQGPGGLKGFAERHGMFRPGDILVSIDDEHCEFSPSAMVKARLKSSSRVGFKKIRIKRSVAGLNVNYRFDRGSSKPVAISVEDDILLAIHIPRSKDGFLINLREGVSSSGCYFDGYIKKQGVKGFAEVHNLFRSFDKIVEVNGEKCESLPFVRIVELISQSPGNEVSLLVRRKRQSSNAGPGCSKPVDESIKVSNVQEEDESKQIAYENKMENNHANETGTPKPRQLWENAKIGRSANDELGSLSMKEMAKIYGSGNGQARIVPNAVDSVPEKSTVTFSTPPGHSLVHVRIPWSPESYGIRVKHKGDKRGIVFQGFANCGEEKTYAEREGLLEKGDQFLAIDGEKCDTLPTRDAIAKLKEKTLSEWKSIVVLRRLVGPSKDMKLSGTQQEIDSFHVLKKTSDEVDKPQMAKEFITEKMLINDSVGGFQTESTISRQDWSVVRFRLPWSENGHRLKVRPRDVNGGAIFLTYCRNGGEKGYAEENNLLESGDEIVEVEGEKCDSWPYRSIVNSLTTKSRTGWIRVGVKRLMGRSIECMSPLNSTQNSTFVEKGAAIDEEGKQLRSHLGDHKKGGNLQETKTNSRTCPHLSTYVVQCATPDNEEVVMENLDCQTTGTSNARKTLTESFHLEGALPKTLQGQEGGEHGFSASLSGTRNISSSVSAIRGKQFDLNGTDSVSCFGQGETSLLWSGRHSASETIATQTTPTIASNPQRVPVIEKRMQGPSTYNFGFPVSPDGFKAVSRTSPQRGYMFAATTTNKCSGSTANPEDNRDLKSHLQA